MARECSLPPDSLGSRSSSLSPPPRSPALLVTAVPSITKAPRFVRSIVHHSPSRQPRSAAGPEQHPIHGRGQDVTGGDRSRFLHRSFGQSERHSWNHQQQLGLFTRRERPGTHQYDPGKRGNLSGFRPAIVTPPASPAWARPRRTDPGALHGHRVLPEVRSTPMWRRPGSTTRLPTVRDHWHEEPGERRGGQAQLDLTRRTITWPEGRAVR